MQVSCLVHVLRHISKKNDKCFDLSKKSALQPTKINTSLEVCMVKMILFKVCGLHHVILLSQSFRITTATLETGYWLLVQIRGRNVEY